MFDSKGIGNRSIIAIIIILVAAVGVGTFVFTMNGEPGSPEVEVQDQSLTDSTVVIDSVVAREQGWLVIHRDDNGALGAVIGYSAVDSGTNEDVEVEIDNSQKTDTLYAMLHVDTGQRGTYEFPGGDPPVEVDGEIVVKAFSISGTSQADVEWAMEGNAFSPTAIEVDVGDTVRITNEDSFIHNFTAQNSETGEVVISQTVSAGGSLTFTFDTEGVWEVWCTIHSDGTGSEPATSGMKGRVGVGVSVSSNDGDGNGDGGLY